MKIKRLDIVGFKSFVDKVSLDFQQGITGVVGPNGCGKSNIVDAIRWVMGEQNARHLRGRMMEDVIFGGSESRKPHGLAQVSVVFDNSAGVCPPEYKDYAEIMVTRRLHRSGESDYLINKTPCRLLDITELFMDTGVGARSYSIIEQGKVGMLVSAKPEERRSLIEEAAGVTKFKARKKTALRKMDATRQNLIRLGDIITEVRRQISSLKRQAQRAEKFREYRGEVKRIELSLTGNRFQSLGHELSLVDQRQQEQAAILARLDARLEEGDLQLEEQQLKVTAAETEHNRLQQQVYQSGTEIQKAENDLLLSGRQREHLLQQDHDLQSELESLAERLKSLENEREQLRLQDRGADETLDELRRVVAGAEAALQEKVSHEQQLNQQYENHRSELMELFSHSNRLSNRREEVSRRLAAETGRRQQLESNAASLGEQLEAVEKKRQDLILELNHVCDRQEGLQTAREDLEVRYRTTNEKLKLAEVALDEQRHALEKERSMQESLQELQRQREGYSEGVRSLLATSDPQGRVLADILTVSEDYEAAVAMALGDRLQAVLPSGSVDAANVFRHLSQQQARATLLNAVALHPVSPFAQGTPLVEKVAAQQGCEAIIEQLFCGVYVVSDVMNYLDHPLDPGTLLVDQAGRCLDWQGFLSGGATSVGSSGLLRRKRQLDEVEARIGQLEAVFAAGQAGLEELREEVIQLDEERSAATSRAHLLELQAVELGKDRQGLQAEADHLNSRLALIIHDLEQIDEGHDSLKREEQELTVGLSRTGERQKDLETTSAGFQAQLTAVRLELERAREGLTSQRVELAALQQHRLAMRETLTRIDRQTEEINQSRTRIEQKKTSARDSSAQLETEEAQLRARLEVLLDHRTELQKRADQSRLAYEQQRSAIEDSREQLRSIRSEAEELRKGVAQLQLRRHELQVDREHVRQTVLERYRVDLLEHQVPEATDDEQERQRQQLRRLQQRIESLGEVNLMAIEEYREQEERYDFLSQQRDDLNQSLDDLQKAISQINRTTRRRFKETFEQVNEKFKQVFPRLFRGGQAELRLTDENDLLETGIDIIVQPPGKRLQNVNLLSGGEKALTAVALIFSLFLIKPTPFCILDEVDAPLDDVNIDRFADMVKEMTDQSQFIIITHSKRTMAILDTMYGVTMQEPGVSKLVSVRLNEFKGKADSPEALSA